MKSIFICCAFLVMQLSYGSPSSVLIIRPDTYSYKKFEMTLKRRLENNVKVQSATPHNPSDLRTIFENNTSQLVVVLDKTLISTWTELHKKNPHVNVTSIFIGSEFDRSSIVNSIKHNCTILYRIGLKQYIDNAYKLTEKKAHRIGIIYSSKSLRSIQAFKNDCNHLNVSLFPYALSSSNTETSIKSILTNLTAINNIDLLIIPDDPLVINSQNFKTIWDRQLKSLAVPVAIPSAFLSDISRPSNTFSLQQDLSEIIEHTAKLILEVKSNNWRITRREISAEKGICLLPKQKFDKAEKDQEYASTIVNKSSEDPELKSTPSSDVTINNNLQPTVIPPRPDRQTSHIQPGNENNLEKTAASLPNIKSADTPNNKPSGKPVTVFQKQAVHFSNQDQDQKQKSQHYVHHSSGHSKSVEKVHIKSAATDHVKQPVNPDGTHGYTLMLSTMIIFIVVLSGIILIYRNNVVHSNAKLKKYLLLKGKQSRIKYSPTNKKSVSIKKIIKSFGHQVIVLKNSHSLHHYLQHHTIDLLIIDFSVNHYIQSAGFQTLMDCSAHLTLLFYNVSNTAAIKQNFRYVQKLFVFNDTFTISDLNKVLFMININDCTSHKHSVAAESYLEGIFHKDTLFEIFQLIDTSKKTGCLLVENDDQSGMIFFEEGVITYAISNMILAEDAVFTILSQKHGSFRFISDKKPITRHLYLNVQSALLERARIEDETTHTNLELLQQQYALHTTAALDNQLTGAFDSCVNAS